MGRGSNLLYGKREAPKRSAPKRITASPDDFLARFVELANNNPYSDKPRFQGLKFVADSPLLQAPPTNKEYRGHIAIGPHSSGKGDIVFVGITAFGRENCCGSQGKREYEGSDLSQAILTVNNKLAEKQNPPASKDQYSSVNGTYAKLNIATVRKSIQAALGQA